ncbi:peptide ABC transporter substrate-binding protein [Ursidibacter sp. B-7004-1]
MKFAKFFTILTACLGFITACDQKTEPKLTISEMDKSPTELTRAIYSAHLQLDPHLIKATADASPVRDLLVGLMRFNSAGEVVPAIAKEFFSDDHKNWLFILDDQAKWSNGEAVIADDFVASWQRLADKNNRSSLAHYLIYMGVENAKEIIQGTKVSDELGVKALNSHTLQIQLVQANPNFPKMLAHIALLPTYRGQKPEEYGFISNGDYRIKERSKTTLTLQSQQSDTAFQTVLYQLITTIQNPSRFDIVENPLASYTRNQIMLPRLCTYFYEFNFNDPMLKRKEVRQAIQAMLSTSQIANGVGIANYFVLPKTMLENSERPLPKFSAEQILHQIDIDVKSPIQISLTYDDHKPHNTIATRIARRLGQSDLFRIDEQAVSWEELLAKRNAQQFQLIRSGWCADYEDPLSFLTMFHSSSPDNKSGYHNERVNQSLESLQSEALSQAEREQKILDTVYELQKDIAILPLFQYQRRVTVLPDIQGIKMNNSSEVIYSKDLYRQKKDTQ